MQAVLIRVHQLLCLLIPPWLQNVATLTTSKVSTTIYTTSIIELFPYFRLFSGPQQPRLDVCLAYHFSNRTNKTDVNNAMITIMLMSAL